MGDGTEIGRVRGLGSAHEGADGWKYGFTYTITDESIETN